MPPFSWPSGAARGHRRRTPRARSVLQSRFSKRQLGLSGRAAEPSSRACTYGVSCLPISQTRAASHGPYHATAYGQAFWRRIGPVLAGTRSPPARKEPRIKRLGRHLRTWRPDDAPNWGSVDRNLPARNCARSVQDIRAATRVVPWSLMTPARAERGQPSAAPAVGSPVIGSLPGHCRCPVGRQLPPAERSRSRRFARCPSCAHASRRIRPTAACGARPRRRASSGQPSVRLGAIDLKPRCCSSQQRSLADPRRSRSVRSRPAGCRARFAPSAHRGAASSHARPHRPDSGSACR
jgi:hypothetical protein